MANEHKLRNHIKTCFCWRSDLAEVRIYPTPSNGSGGRGGGGKKYATF